MRKHRNVARKHFCPECDHFHAAANMNIPNALGRCLKDPPAAFVLGMVQTAPAVVVDPAAGGQMSPVIRAYYPPVGAEDTCSQGTPRPAGEA